jgi:hypothetical protein
MQQQGQGMPIGSLETQLLQTIGEAGDSGYHVADSRKRRAEGSEIQAQQPPPWHSKRAHKVEPKQQPEQQLQDKSIISTLTCGVTVKEAQKDPALVLNPLPAPTRVVKPPGMAAAGAMAVALEGTREPVAAGGLLTGNARNEVASVKAVPTPSVPSAATGAADDSRGQQQQQQHKEQQQQGQVVARPSGTKIPGLAPLGQHYTKPPPSMLEEYREWVWAALQLMGGKLDLSEIGSNMPDSLKRYKRVRKTAGINCLRKRICPTSWTLCLGTCLWWLLVAHHLHPHYLCQVNDVEDSLGWGACVLQRYALVPRKRGF